MKPGDSLPNPTPKTPPTHTPYNSKIISYDPLEGKTIFSFFFFSFLQACQQPSLLWLEVFYTLLIRLIFSKKKKKKSFFKRTRNTPPFPFPFPFPSVSRYWYGPVAALNAPYLRGVMHSIPKLSSLLFFFPFTPPPFHPSTPFLVAKQSLGTL